MYFKYICMKKITKLLAVIAILFTNFLSSSVYAADWYVGTSNYGNDVSHGTSAAAPFQTIAYAITSAAANDIIHIADGTYTENNITVNKTLTFQGTSKAGTIIQANAAKNTATSPVFGNLNGGTANNTVNISNLTIKNGKRTSGDGGGAISSSTTYTLTLNMTNVLFLDNVASGNGGGLRLQGGYIATLTDCEFSGNSGSSGGAIFLRPNTLSTSSITLNNCYLHDNSAGTGGGGVISGPNSGISGNKAFTISINNSTFSTNTTTGNGGAILITDGNTGGADVITITNSTFYGNTVTGAAKCGGAIYYSTGVTTSMANNITLNHVTVKGNTTVSGTGGDGVCVANGGGQVTSLVINNSIVVGNSGSTSNASQVGTDAVSQSKIKTTATSGSSYVSNSILGVYDNSWGVNNQATTNDYDYNNKTNAVVADLALAGSLSAHATPVLTIGNTSTARNYVTTNKLGSPITIDQIGQSRVNATDAGAYENQVIQYNIAATASTGGTVTSGTGNYDVSSSCTLVATPAQGYAFDSWTEGESPVVGAGASYMFTVSASRTLVANFVSTGTPTVLVSGSTLTDFIYAPGAGPSSEKSFTVSGTNLKSNISITAPVNYEISTGTEGSFVAISPITLAKDGSGAVSSTTINVRLKAGLSTATAYNNETITISSTDVTDQTVTCSGRVLATVPTLQASNASASNVLHTTADLSWTAGDGTKTLVLFSTNASDLSAYPPVGGTTYTVGSTTHAGCIVGYVGTGNSANISGLTAGSTNYFAVFTFNDNGSNSFENYLTGSPASANAITIVASNTNDYFQSTTSGNWATTSIWNSSSDNSSWHLASLAPVAAANTVTITTAGSPITATADILAPGFSMQDGTKFIWNAAVDFGTSGTKKAIKGTGTVNFDAISSSPSLTTSNYFINFAAAGNTTTTINVGLGNAAQTGTTTFNWNGVSQANYPAGVQLNATNNTSGTARIQIPRDALTDRKLHLGSGVAITRGDGNGGVYSIGELNGVAGSFLEGENSALINISKEIIYTIGSLNTDCEFAGSLIQFNNDPTKNNVNLDKVGTGKLKLSGTSTHNGTVNVTAGTLEVTGAVNGTGAVTVASGSILKGTGIITGTTTVNGILEGKLRFGSSLTLAGTTNLTIGGFAISQYDTIAVTGALTRGGTLNIDITAAAPAVGTQIRLFKVGSQSGTFTMGTVTSGYSFNQTTNILTYVGSAKEWIGDATWSTAANWSGATTPDSGADIVVSSGSLTIDQTAVVTNLTVIPGAKVTLNSGSDLTVTSMKLQSGTTGNTATFVDADATGKTITATVEQHLTSGRNWYISCPTKNTSYTELSTAGSVQYYDEPTSSWKTVISGNLIPGKGYISVATASTGNIDFSGELNTGNVEVALTRRGSTKPGFNLIANPYASYLDAVKAIRANPNMERTIWYRTKNATAYLFETVNATSGVGTGTSTRLIPPMQAFWVRTITDNNSITFTNAMRYHANGTIGDTAVTTTAMKVRKSAPSQVVRLRVSNGINSDEAVLYFNEKASDAYDAYDSQKMTNNNVAIPEIYTQVGTNQLVINGMSAIPVNTEIPLGFATGQSNTYTLKLTELTNVDENTRVYLLDKLLNTEIELNTVNEYSFTSDLINNTSRFSVIFKANALTTGDLKIETDKVHVYVNHNNHIVFVTNEMLTGENIIKVFDATGRKLTEKSIVSSVTEMNEIQTSGVYVVNALVNGKSFTAKVSLNK